MNGFYNGIKLSKYNSAPIEAPLVGSGAYFDKAQNNFDLRTGNAQRLLGQSRLLQHAGYGLNNKPMSFASNPYGAYQQILGNASQNSVNQGFGAGGRIANLQSTPQLHDLNQQVNEGTQDYRISNKLARTQFGLNDARYNNNAAQYGYQNGIWRVAR